jgi:hypothetical protein
LSYLATVYNSGQLWKGEGEALTWDKLRSLRKLRKGKSQCLGWPCPTCLWTISKTKYLPFLAKSSVFRICLQNPTYGQALRLGNLGGLKNHSPGISKYRLFYMGG